MIYNSSFTNIALSQDFPLITITEGTSSKFFRRSVESTLLRSLCIAAVYISRNR